MLILSRKVNEAIIINEDVEIRVLTIRGNQVSIGINAPKEVTINREEIHKKIQSERSNK